MTYNDVDDLVHSRGQVFDEALRGKGAKLDLAGNWATGCVVEEAGGGARDGVTLGV